MSDLLNSASDGMDKKNIQTSSKRPSFFEIFKAQCSESDLGPISLNWFEELTSEAPSYATKRVGDHEHETDSLDQNTFKTPKGKLSMSSPTVSTPMIFKEQNKDIPLFASPIKETMDRSNTETGGNVSKIWRMRTQVSQSNDIASPSSSCLVARTEMSETPQDTKCVLRRNLLSTPNPFELQIPKCISESLGAEADPDMSWSSSLATPPTLSPTVIIDRGNNSLPESKQHAERIELIMCSLFSKYGRSCSKNSMNVESVSRTEDVCAESDSCKVLNGSFGKNIPASKLDGYEMTPDTPKDRSMHDRIKSDASTYLASSKTLLRKARTIQQSKNTCFGKRECDESQENSEAITGSKEDCLTKVLISSKGNLKKPMTANSRPQKHSKNQKDILGQEEMPSSLLSSWSQVDFSDLEITQLEKEFSRCTGSSAVLQVKESFDSNLASIVKEYPSSKTLESFMLHTSAHMERQKLLNICFPEKLPPPEASSLLDICKTEHAAFVSASESNSLPVENITSADLPEVSSSCCTNYSGQGCKMSCGHLHDNILPAATRNSKEPTKSGLKADSKISSLKRRPKKFIYIINNTVYQKEGMAHSGGSSACPDLRSCITEVSETLNRNDGQTEEVSSSKKHSVEELLRSDKDCILANGFSKTPDNERKNTENDFTYRSLVSLQKGNKKTILPSHIDAKQLIEIRENSFCANSQKEALNHENSGNCFSLINFDTLSEANVVGSALSIQASKSKHADSDIIAQHFFSSCTQMGEDGYQSQKDPEVTAEESSELLTPRKNVDTKQFLPLHIKENANLTRQRRLKCINQSNTHSFSGFKTASDKQIELSDNIIRKGKLLFKDIEDLFPDEIQNISNQNTEKHPGNVSLGRKEMNENPSNLSLLSDSLVNCAQFNDTQNILPECTNISSLKMLKNQQLRGGQNLTASQEAEVAELSNILEESGSQFDFTQFRKHITVVCNNTCEVIGTFDKNGMSSEVCIDTNFEENPQRRNHTSTAKEFKIHTQSVEEIASTNLSTKENKSFPIVSAPLQYGICGFSSPDAKEMNASDVIINKAESDSDMKEVDETLAKFQIDCLNRCNSWCNYVKEMDMLQRDEVNPHMTKNYSEDTKVSIKEAVDKSKDQNCNKGNIIQITHTTEFNLKFVKKYSVQVTGNDLSPAEKKSSLQNAHSVNCGENRCNYNSQDSVSDLTCLTEVAKTEKESIVHHSDERENLNCNQKGVNNPESYSFLQSVHTVADANTVADKNKMFHLLASSCAEEALDNMFFQNGTTDATSEKGIISVTKRTVISENDALCGSNHQETFETRKERQVNAKGFQTANGKPIIITDESLAKARDLLSEETLFLEKQEKVGNLVRPGLQASTDEGRDEKIHNLREEFGKGAEQQREALHSDRDFENPLNLLSNTVMHTETTREPCFSLSVSEADSVCHTQREKIDTANKTLLGKVKLPSLSKKNIVSKSLFTDSGIQHVSVTEGFGIGANQDHDHSSSRNTSNVLISSIKNGLDSLDSSGSAISKANYLDLKNDHTLDHSCNAYCGTDSPLENLSCFSEEAASKSLNSENDFSMFGEVTKNERSTTEKGTSNLSDTNSLEKDKVPERTTSPSKLLKTRTDAFSTASGKTIEISQEALKKARQLLHEDCYKSTEQNIVSQPETERHSTLKSCSDTSNSRKHVTSSNYLNLEKNSLEKSAEPQQSRSQDYHENDQALLFMDAKIESSCQAPNPQINDKCFDTYPSVKLNCTKSNISTGKANFFSTASGKPVKLSEESLRKARLLFSEMENDSPYHQSHVSDGDHIYDKVSPSKDKITPRNNKPLMTEGKSIQNIEVNTNIPCGFSTASGKQVHISQKALQNVMGLLKEFDDDITGNGFFADQQGLGQGHVSSIKTPTTELKLEDEISSKYKLHDKSNGLYLTTRNPSEKNLKIPTCNSFKEEYKQLTGLEEKFSCSKVIEPFLKTNQTCLRKAGSNYPAKYDTITKRELSFHSPVYFQSPDYLEAEASESAKVFMEDEDLIDVEVQKNKNKFVLNPGKTNNFLPFTRKRCTEKENIFGEPPIKRKLLPEFDESERSKRSSLKVSTSIPEDTMNDRKKITYDISFKPMVCGPFSSTKEQEVLNPNYTTPDQHLKRLKSGGFPQYISKQSSTRSSGYFTQFNKIASEEEGKTENHITKKPVKVFVPPFKTKSRTSENKICSSKEWVNESINGLEQSSCTEVHVNTTDPEGDNSMQIPAVDSECKETDSDLTKIIANLHCAQNLQEMRIMKKQKQRIHPQPGNLYLVKTSASSSRIPLKVAVEEKLPGSYLSEQLYGFGVSRQCIKINSSNAEDFQFYIQDFFSRECFLEKHGIQLADGGYLILNNDGKAGKEEFYRALCDTPGVDPKLISKAWVYNHYRWIIWKLAAMEVAFPHKFASKCLTPERVLLQLKYRYDVEVDKSHRSAIKRITERDDVAAKRIILCISKIISLSTSLSHVFGNKNTAEENKKEVAVIEVTDGWYGIRAVLDSPLQSLLCRQKLMVGQKIVIHGAELVGSQDASTPLEAPESLMLKISANSTRRARWYAKLGYYWDPRPFCLPLSSLFSDGGTVGCIDVIVQRIYPTQWMEKTRGSFVFRNGRAEEREAAKHAEERQKMLEVLLAKIQADLEEKEGESKSILRSRTLTRQQIRSLQDGAELYEAVLNAGDPVYMEGCFGEEQIKALNNYRQMVNDKKKAQIEVEFRKAVESVEQDEHSSCKRDVTAVIKLRILDYKNERSRKEVILNIWRPSSDVCNLLKEGNRYQIFQVVASHYKGKSDVSTVQLTATRKTQYQQMPVSQEILSQAYRPRECLKFSKLLEASFQPACSEVDLVGYIVSLRKGIGSSTLVYMSDKDHELIAVQISADFKQLAIEDIIVPSVLISATNLQWQPNFKSEIPTIFAGNLSVFSSNPKEPHLQGEFNELRKIVENDNCYGKDAQSRLMTLLQADDALVLNMPQACGFSPFPSPWKSSATNKHSAATPSSEQRHQSSFMVDVKPLVSLSSAKLIPEPPPPRNCKKRKAMDLLCQVPSPPPVNPVCTFISPSLKRAFQPPRSTQHERSLKGTECEVKKTALRRLNKASFSFENYFVADEELAMISTQGFINNYPEERGTDSVDKTGSRIQQSVVRK